MEREREWPADVHKVPLPFWDTGVLHTALLGLGGVPGHVNGLSKEAGDAFYDGSEALLAMAKETAPPQAEYGTYRGAQLALTKVYNMIEQRYSSYMDHASFEPSMPYPLSMEEKRRLFSFTDPKTDGYPPHLDLAANKPAADMNPSKVQRSTRLESDNFDNWRRAQMSALLPAMLPKTFVGRTLAYVSQDAAAVKLGEMGRPDEGETLADVEQYNKRMREKGDSLLEKNDVFNLPNFGDIDDWYSDRRFAQQHFTGPNPTTLEFASDRWLRHFIDNATEDASDQKMKKKIQDLVANDRDSLYMQDYSYFRRAAGLSESEQISCDFEESYHSGNGVRRKISQRYGVASVCLFHLPEDGQLQPLAIVLDWRGSAAASVTIYNKELPLAKQREDWPWRYAKTCVQTSDWIRHEVTVHLINTHFIEESTIVAAQRCFEDSHPILQLLYPHWQKTLSINAGARMTLVPHVIIEIIGFTTEQAKKFIMSEYESFDFKGRYVPTDLARRGFPPEKRHETKYKNYAYARCIHSMWFKIRAFVEDMLSIHYKRDGGDADEAVQADTSVAAWSATMQRPGGPGDDSGAGITSFPTISTFDELVDCVTMCIHLASPQHTAVNYLQNYYQSFVPNKPSCLYRQPPVSIQKLRTFTEQNLVEALPMNHPREWLLASHIPYLLSAKPGDKESLIVYAASKYHWYLHRNGPDDAKVRDAAAKFYSALAESEEEFARYGEETWDSKDVHYNVLSPSWNAVSIVI